MIVLFESKPIAYNFGMTNWILIRCYISQFLEKLHNNSISLMLKNQESEAELISV